MRFYQLVYATPITYGEGLDVEEVKAEWFGTEREGVVRRGELFKGGKNAGLKREAKIKIVEVPSDKKGLLNFLKANVTGPVIV